jgi:hypothetical protein
VFAVECTELGELQKISIEHDGSGPSSSWFLERIAIRDVITGTKYYFHANTWLAEDRGDMTKLLEIQASLDSKPPVVVRLFDVFRLR